MSISKFKVEVQCLTFNHLPIFISFKREGWDCEPELTPSIVDPHK